jgi:hypothetical protein
MNCRKIFNQAATLIAEDPYDENNEDLYARSVGAMNTFIYNTYDISKMYEMRALKYPEPSFREVDDVDDEFPLCDEMAGACIYYLASVLTNNENTELSDRLASEYRRLIDNIVRKIPAEVEKISDVYGYN